MTTEVSCKRPRESSESASNVEANDRHLTILIIDGRESYHGVGAFLVSDADAPTHLRALFRAAAPRNRVYEFVDLQGAWEECELVAENCNWDFRDLNEEVAKMQMQEVVSWLNESIFESPRLRPGNSNIDVIITLVGK